jgi:pimeloyl-ACP methyl ester carboxylesterase
VATITRHHADLGEVILHYLEAGEGPPVVLLHGIPQTSHEWRHVVPHLASSHRVIAPDLRGLGDSSRPAGGYDKRTIGADIVALVRDHLGLERIFLVGHDWGGPVAFSIAAHHPDLVRRLAILDVVIPGDGGDFSQGGRRWHHALFRTLELPEALFTGREDLLLTWFFRTYGHLPDCIPEPDKREYLRCYTQPGAMRAMFEFYRALPRDAADNQAVLKGGKIRMPVLALGGDKSFGRGMEVIESLRRVAEDVRGGLVPNSGHWLPEEQPGFVAAQLLDFFAEENDTQRPT